MTKVVQGARILLRRSEISGETPTIPPNNDHTTGWLDTDIYEGEIFINDVDKRAWVRTSGTTVPDAMSEFAFLTSNGTLPYRYFPSTIAGALIYQGTWNATTNSPNLLTINPEKGDYWVVSVSGTTNMGLDETGNQLNDWNVTDWIVYDGNLWGIVVNSDIEIPMIASEVIYTNTDYPSITNVQNALDQLLYVNPTCSLSVVIAGQSVYGTLAEVNSTLSSGTLNWSVNKNMSSISITGPNFTTVNPTTPPFSGSYPITNLPTTTTTYNMSATDSKPATANSSASIIFTQRVYWGVSSNTNFTTSADIMSLVSTGGSVLSTTKVSPVTIADGMGEYIYYCYPASYGPATFTIGGFLTGLILTTVSYTNSYGSTPVLYNVYRNSVTTGSGTSVTLYVA